MDEGIHYDISNDDYHQGEGISSSEIKVALTNIAQWKRDQDKKKEGVKEKEKDHFLIGAGMHSLLLEPDTFKWDDQPAVVVKNSDMIEGMVGSIKAHPEAGSIFNGSGLAEFSCYYRDPITGLLLKARPDFYRDDIPHILFDVKSARDASEEGFSRALGNFKYYISAAYYLDIVRQFLVRVDKFVFIVVEKTPPYYVAVYPLADSAVDLGRLCYREGLEKIKYAQEGQRFPGYNDDEVTEIDLPRYIYSQMESKFNSSF